MRKSIITFFVALATLAVSAGSPVKFGVFNHLGVDVGVGTTGRSFEAATPVTPFLQMRAGVSYLPDFNFTTDATVHYMVSTPVGDQRQDATIDLTGGFGRTQGHVIFNFYPAPMLSSFYVAAGAYFGGSTLVKITGHNDDLAAYASDGVATIGDYTIPVDKDGNVRGGLRVKGFRPYVGLGFGRPVPKRLLNFNIELGVQFHGRPSLYTDYGELGLPIEKDNDDFQKIIDNVKVWPVLTFKLAGKIF